MAVLNVPAEQAREMVFGDSEEGILIEEMITSTTRWSVHRVAIIEYQGKFWKVMYSVGATEQQDELPFQDVKYAKFEEVKKVPVTSYRWEVVQ